MYIPRLSSFGTALVQNLPAITRGMDVLSERLVHDDLDARPAHVLLEFIDQVAPEPSWRHWHIKEMEPARLAQLFHDTAVATIGPRDELARSRNRAKRDSDFDADNYFKSIIDQAIIGGVQLSDSSSHMSPDMEHDLQKLRIVAAAGPALLQVANIAYDADQEQFIEWSRVQNDRTLTILGRLADADTNGEIAAHGDGTGLFDNDGGGSELDFLSYGAKAIRLLINAGWSNNTIVNAYKDFLELSNFSRFDTHILFETIAVDLAYFVNTEKPIPTLFRDLDQEIGFDFREDFSNRIDALRRMKAAGKSPQEILAAFQEIESDNRIHLRFAADQVIDPYDMPASLSWEGGPEELPEEYADMMPPPSSRWPKGTLGTD